MKIANGSKIYLVGRKVASDEHYDLFLCEQEGIKRQCLLQIATAVEQNGSLERAAYILKELELKANELEKEYEGVKKESAPPLNYSIGFPEIVDTFICFEQGNRRINILAFRSIEDVSQMVPLINIKEKDSLRIDLRTSGWIIGKLLKLLAFTHSLGISISLVNEKNILIEPNLHLVLIFDWSNALTHSGEIPMNIRRDEISQAARAIIITMGGNLETYEIPDDGDPNFDQYTAYLLRLARGGESKAERAHANFYDLIDPYWPRKFYPFTTKPLI